MRRNNDRNSNKRVNKEPLSVEEMTVSRAFPLKLDGATEEQFAVKCAELLLDQHEWASGNCNGINAPAHDRLKLNRIKDLRAVQHTNQSTGCCVEKMCQGDRH